MGLPIDLLTGDQDPEEQITSDLAQSRSEAVDEVINMPKVFELTTKVVLDNIGFSTLVVALIYL